MSYDSVKESTYATESSLTRREVLKGSSLSAIGVALAGCTSAGASTEECNEVSSFVLDENRKSEASIGDYTIEFKGSPDHSIQAYVEFSRTPSEEYLMKVTEDTRYLERDNPGEIPSFEVSQIEETGDDSLEISELEC